jgi:hypothetical protein
MARRGGTRHPELIFLHSASADGFEARHQTGVGTAGAGTVVALLTAPGGMSAAGDKRSDLPSRFHPFPGLTDRVHALQSDPGAIKFQPLYYRRSNVLLSQRRICRGQVEAGQDHASEQISGDIPAAEQLIVVRGRRGRSLKESIRC